MIIRRVTLLDMHSSPQEIETGRLCMRNFYCEGAQRIPCGIATYSPSSPSDFLLLFAGGCAFCVRVPRSATDQQQIITNISDVINARTLNDLLSKGRSACDELFPGHKRLRRLLRRECWVVLKRSASTCFFGQRLRYVNAASSYVWLFAETPGIIPRSTV